MNTIIAGSRGFENYSFMVSSLDKLFSRIKPGLIISGGARGADLLGERYGRENGIPVKTIRPNWSKGKAAGYARNVEMAKIADSCVVFWDGKSPGTAHMINIAKKQGLSLRIVKIK